MLLGCEEQDDLPSTGEIQVILVEPESTPKIVMKETEIERREERE